MTSRLSPRAFAIACLALLALPPSLTAEVRPAMWTQYRGDRQLTGRATGVGSFQTAVQPEWSVRISGREGYVEIDPGLPANELALPDPNSTGSGYLNPANQIMWQVGPPALDLYGTGANVQIAEGPTFKVAKILPDVQGLQRFEMQTYYTHENSARGTLYSYQNGSAQQVWQTPPVDNAWGPVAIVTDVNLDGQPDIAMSSHYRLIFIDGATGQFLHPIDGSLADPGNSRYHNARNYGWFGSANIDDDPYPEFCVISDFASHIEVLDWDGSQFHQLWRKEIENVIVRNKKVVRPGPAAFLDLDADGDVEVFLNLYDHTGDKQWHFVAYDAWTGNVQYDFPQRYLEGVGDLNGDGLYELFVSDSAGLATPTYAPVRILNLNPAAPASPTQLFHDPYAKWHARDVDQMPLTANTMAADGRRTVVLRDANDDGDLDFFLSRPDPVTGVETAFAYDLNGGSPSLIWSIQGAPGMQLNTIAAANVDADGRTESLLHLTGRAGPGQLLATLQGGAALHMWAYSTTNTGTPVVADLENDGIVEVIVQTGNEEILCLEAPRYVTPGAAPRERWRVRGRGMTNSAPLYHGVSAADVDGDGDLEVLLSQEADNGQASLVAVDPDGSILWRCVFPDFDGSPPIWNFGGLTFWTAGHFRTLGHMDVYVSLRRSTMHSDVGFLVDGLNGQILWERDGIWPANSNNEEDGRGHGGVAVACGNLAGDGGLDKLVVEFPDRYYVVDGISGDPDLVVRTDGTTSIFGGYWVAYAKPIIADLFGNAVPEIVWGACAYLTAVMTPQGVPFWNSPYIVAGSPPVPLQAIADVDGNGSPELVGVYGSSVSVQNPANGDTLYTRSVTTPTRDLVSGDLDNDGRDEVLITTNSAIRCFELVGTEFRQTWVLSAGGAATDPAIADVDADGLLEIVVATSSGQLLMFDSPDPAFETGLAHWPDYH
ncbi:MAG TPA: VCBS repeat-containing protein [Candidatus Sumerlaeota bacterium]|nr:VCBS repeat-containing protein [Candidatus Sumerlaeota bacterium]HOR27793.1 VCBS repeat-containing protein [Candidatus Sumerlaeota bacterium]HPK03761.1 VCBS repeat-containing protein [Candidatus Sumerlaeota bacterium]